MSGPSAPLIHKRPKATDQTLEFWWEPPISDGGSPIQTFILTDGINAVSDLTYYYKVTGLENKSSYTYSLAASNATDIGEYALFRTVQPGLKSPPPQLLTGTTLTSTTASIVWTNSTFNTSTPSIYRNVIKAYNLDPSGNILPSSILFKQVLGLDAETTFSTILTLPSSLTGYKVSVQGVNDPGYAFQTYTGPVCGGALPFTPTSIPGCELWCDATSLALSDNDPITTWNPSGGVTYGLSGTATFKANVIGSNPVVEVTTAQGLLDTSSGTFIFSPYSLFMVTRQTGGTNGRVFQENGQNALLGYWGGYKDQWFSSAWIVGPGSTPSDTNWDIYSFSKDNAGYCLMNRFGSNIASNINNAQGIYGLAVNAGTFGGESSDCQIGEVILYSGELAYSNIERVEGYLAWKWGFETSLPLSHPYRNAKPIG